VAKRKKERREEIGEPTEPAASAPEQSAEPDEPLLPVLTVTCPNCGGAVNDAELGKRTTCTFCGTDLHLPRIDSTPDEPPEPPREQEPPSDGVLPSLDAANPAPPRPQWGLLLGVFTLMVGFVVWMAWRSPMSPDVPSSPDPVAQRDPEISATVCHGNCLGACGELPIDNTHAMTKCMDACEKKCNYPPKIPIAECHAKCDDKCGGAPNESTRLSCVGSCKAACSH
jgi:hypothetical protein